MNALHLAGVGVISPAGLGISFLPRPAGLREWGAEKLPDLDPEDYHWTGLKRLSRINQYGCIAAGEAFRSAGCSSPLHAESGPRTGLVVSTSYSNLEPIVSMYNDARQYGVNQVNPRFFPDTVMNAFAGHISIYFHITGTSVTLSDAVPSAPSAFVYASDLLRGGQFDAVMCCMLHVHSPTVLDQVVYRDHNHCSSESIVALLFKRPNESMKGCPAIVSWTHMPEGSGGSTAPIIKPSDSFLATAAAYSGIIHRKSTVERWCVSSRSGGYYDFTLRIGEEGKNHE